MSEFTSRGSTSKTLPDPWERSGPIPLNGVLERNRYHPALVALFALIIGIAGYIIIGNFAIVLFFMLGGTSLEAMLQDMAGVMAEQPGLVLSANAVGLFLGLGLVALILVRFHTSRPWAYLRLRKPDPAALALSLVGLIALIPIVQWAGTINEMLPLPEWLRAMEEVQMELLEKVMQGDVSVMLSLIMVALTPALCEEVFFRGYLQRHLERSFGAAWSIVVIGFVFGAFHLRLTQILPLSLLGVYLAYLTWRTGSLWIPILVHFANNGLAVITAEIVKNRPELDITDLEQISVPWYLVVVGLVVFCGIVYVLHIRTQNHLAEQTAVSVDTHVTGAYP